MEQRIAKPMSAKGILVRGGILIATMAAGMALFALLYLAWAAGYATAPSTVHAADSPASHFGVHLGLPFDASDDWDCSPATWDNSVLGFHLSNKGDTQCRRVDGRSGVREAVPGFGVHSQRPHHMMVALCPDGTVKSYIFNVVLTVGFPGAMPTGIRRDLMLSTHEDIANDHFDAGWDHLKSSPERPAETAFQRQDIKRWVRTGVENPGDPPEWAFAVAEVKENACMPAKHEFWRCLASYCQPLTLQLLQCANRYPDDATAMEDCSRAKIQETDAAGCKGPCVIHQLHGDVPEDDVLFPGWRSD